MAWVPPTPGMAMGGSGLLGGQVDGDDHVLDRLGAGAGPVPCAWWTGAGGGRGHAWWRRPVRLGDDAVAGHHVGPLSVGRGGDGEVAEDRRARDGQRDGASAVSVASSTGVTALGHTT